MNSSKSGKLTPEAVQVTATMIGLTIPENELADTSERLMAMLEFHDELLNMVDDFPNPDVHFNPSWNDFEGEQS